MLGIIFPTDELHDFQRGRAQPSTRLPAAIVWGPTRKSQVQLGLFVVEMPRLLAIWGDSPHRGWCPQLPEMVNVYKKLWKNPPCFNG